MCDKDTNVPNKTDFISRETAKTLIHDRAIEMALNNVGFKADASDILEHISKRSIDWIDEVPAADVRPVRKGHYIIDDMGDSSCSECGEKYLDVTKRFCPECGAEIGPTQEGI